MSAPFFPALDYLAISIGEVRISALLLLRAGLVTAGVIWCAILSVTSLKHVSNDRKMFPFGKGAVF